MLKRFLAVALMALAAAANSGCCGCMRERLCSAHLCRHFNCPDCGDVYWSEWFSDPPDCCDPCDCHGNYVGDHHHGYGPPAAMGPDGLPYGGDEVYMGE